MLNNPLRYTDPSGELTRAEFDAVITTLRNSPNGGSWSADNGMHFFGSQDEAFGWGVGYMNAHGAWGGGGGWASSADYASSKYNGGTITPGMVEGYYRQQWGGQYFNISADYAPNGNGFNITSTFGPTATQDNVRVMHTSYEKMAQLMGMGKTLSGWDKANLLFGATGTGLGLQGELMDYAVRSSFKSARTWSEFNNLRPTQQTWRQAAILGKEGQMVLKFIKGANLGFSAVTSAYSAIDAGSYYYNGGTDWQVGTKATLDIIMTGVGFLGPFGFGISATYFILSTTTNNFGGFGNH